MRLLGAVLPVNGIVKRECWARCLHQNSPPKGPGARRPAFEKFPSAFCTPAAGSSLEALAGRQLPTRRGTQRAGVPQPYIIQIYTLYIPYISQP